MNNILLISEDYLKTNSNLNDNAFGKWILPAIRESQEMGLMPIIGECLYNKICELVKLGLINNEPYVAYKDLLDEKIRPYLMYETLSNIVPIINSKLGNIGTVSTNDEHVINLSQGEADLVKNYYQERADFYAKRLQDWVKSNKMAFPELESCPCDSLQPNLDSATNSVGIWLGGARGKKISTSKCGCGSSQSSTGSSEGYAEGYADGIAYQKSQINNIEITNNGIYNSENGYSPIEVNVPQTGHTDQEIQDAYESGVTDGMTEQKEKLIPLEVTINGNYLVEDGYSEVLVNVPQTGATPILDNLLASENGSYYPSVGIDGFSTVIVSVPQTGHTEQEIQESYESGYTDGYSSGRTDGFAIGYVNGHTDGMEDQKSFMTTASIYGNGTYTREDGWNAVTVNVPTVTTQTLTQAQYDALTIKDPMVIYLILN